jgi:hypothetical protein
MMRKRRHRINDLRVLRTSANAKDSRIRAKNAVSTPVRAKAEATGGGSDC